MNESRSKLKKRIEARNRSLNAFNKWESTHPGSEINSQQIFASLGTIYELLPPEARRREEDPNRSGIRAMHRALRHLNP